jgi:hypothetical protein
VQQVGGEDGAAKGDALRGLGPGVATPGEQASDGGIGDDLFYLTLAVHRVH